MRAATVLKHGPYKAVITISGKEPGTIPKFMLTQKMRTGYIALM